jgi:hypothetical protein
VRDACSTLLVDAYNRPWTMCLLSTVLVVATRRCSVASMLLSKQWRVGDVAKPFGRDWLVRI